jgi:hypothetical protein
MLTENFVVFLPVNWYRIMPVGVKEAKTYPVFVLDVNNKL